MADNDAPTVWVGCLGCYNGGALVGAWFDATDAPQDMAEFAAAGVKVPGAHALEAHEELWCFDFEDTSGLFTGECSPAEARRLGELHAAIVADAYPVSAVVAWHDWCGADLEEWDKPTREAFEDAYAGEWHSEEEYAQDLAESIGAISSDATWPCTCIDWEQAARELFTDYVSVQSPFGVYVFRNV
ncbi:hypothetical protein DDP54_15595 (plasmid) [Cellulomonas sp. WB94]|uniref:antirestriction protein ArdA n=1 Tax=Cellulomonas sp. WB94 TaxID=2173174 RepID=UPI000D5862FD|nr:antirestriction protein ArdA [Cellulomonas sp. WB94]PVU81323.1 hypothetical protein DDP54_15595 [Cellulomonas sp. WB94]